MSDCWHWYEGELHPVKGIEIIKVSQEDIDHLLEGGQLLASTESGAVVITMEDKDGYKSR